MKKVSILSAVFCLTLLAVGLKAQNIVEGESVENIFIGKSNTDTVIANYGVDYKLFKHRDYSFEMFYQSLGLSFYTCQADPNKEIFAIEIQPPFKANTSKGIILGDSTFEDVFKIYGDAEQTSVGFEYEGIFFDFVGREKEYLIDIKNSNSIKSDSDILNEQNIALATSKNNSKNNDFVIDGLKTSGNSLQNSNQNNSINKNAVKEKLNAEKEEKENLKYKKELKLKTVKRFELIEKSGLRQCEVKFRK